MIPFTPIAVPSEFEQDPGAWLAGQARGKMPYLLAHADDGVIWGRIKDGSLELAGARFPEVKVELHASTLQDARLFGADGELYIWRTENGFAARLIANDAEADCIEDHQWLWGTPDGKPVEGFTLLHEGKQGLLHAPPIPVLSGQGVQLTLRHYVEYDDQGQAYIAGSRLTGLEKVEGKHVAETR